MFALAAGFVVEAPAVCRLKRHALDQFTFSTITPLI
jgi:hypothetical protein